MRAVSPSRRNRPDTYRRTEILGTLQKVTVNLVKHVGEIKGMAASVLKDAGGRIYTFGSYRLGVYGPGKDYKCRTERNGHLIQSQVPISIH